MGAGREERWKFEGRERDGIEEGNRKEAEGRGGQDIES